jgi:hypothetical protein
LPCRKRQAGRAWQAEDVIRKMIGEVVPPGHTKIAVFGPMHPVGVKASELLATGASPKVRRCCADPVVRALGSSVRLQVRLIACAFSCAFACLFPR